MARPRYKGYSLVKVFQGDHEDAGEAACLKLADATMIAEGQGMTTHTVGWHNNEYLLYVTNASLHAWGAS